MPSHIGSEIQFLGDPERVLNFRSEPARSSMDDGVELQKSEIVAGTNHRVATEERYPPSSLGMKKTSEPGRSGWK